MRLRYTVALALATFFALWLFWGLVVVEWFATRWGSDRLPLLGQLGDLFGGINALFSAFALVGLAVAAWLQRRQLIDAQAQAKLVQRQHERGMFEPLLFALLDRHKTPAELVSAVTGQGAPFITVVSALRERLKSSPAYAVATLSESTSELVGHARLEYESLYLMNDSALGPYFRSIYHVFRHISQSPIPVEDKLMYASIARAGLSETELFLLTLNGLTERGKGMREYVNEFGLLKHIRRRANIDDPLTVEEVLARSEFSPTATMDRDQRASYSTDPRGGATSQPAPSPGPAA